MTLSTSARTADPVTVRIRAFWAIVVGSWLLVVAGYAVAVAPAVTRGGPIGIAFVVFGVGAAVLWFNGARSLAMWATRAWWTTRAARGVADSTARVALVLCTADDFDPEPLSRSARQTHPVDVVVLDDSVTGRAQRRVDAYAAATGARVLRRTGRRGYKAGNLNAGLRRIHAEYDYVVVLDSDEELPPAFVRQALELFAADPSVGVVQGRHRARGGETAFARLFSGLFETHVAVTQAARTAAGFSMFMGRGAMISTACLRATGGIPEVVTEDVAFSVEARAAGYRIVYAPELVSTEDYPVDYAAFRTQHRKLVEGATELVIGRGRRMLRAEMPLRERVDVLVETSLVPLSALAGVVLLAAGVMLATYSEYPPAWAATLVGVSVAAPLLPEAARRAREEGLVAGAVFLAAGLALYGSTMVLTLRATVVVLAGRPAVFQVTPKERTRTGWQGALRGARAEFGVAASGIAAGLLLTGTIAPVMPLLVPAIAGPALAIMGTRASRAARRPELARVV